jgi:hypothetical protein
VVNIGTIDYTDDRNTLEVITLGMPLEMQGAILNKATAKIAWEALKKMHLGVDQVHQAKANTLLREFDSLKFKDGESMDDFSIRITDLTNQLEVLNNGYTEPEIM